MVHQNKVGGAIIPLKKQDDIPIEEQVAKMRQERYKKINGSEMPDFKEIKSDKPMIRAIEP